MADIITTGEHKPLTAYQQTYHWRNKNCAPWAQEWIKKALPGLSVSEGEHVVEIIEVTSVTGDCDLGQRKGKLLTIYDLAVEAKWTSKVGEDEIKGTVKVPEVSHEAIDGLSDYEYTFSLTTDSSSDASKILALAKKSFPDVLSSKFNELRPALIQAHGVPDGPSGANSGTSTPGAGASTPSYAPAPPAKAPAQSASTSREEKKASGAVVTGKAVEVEAELQASADDLWSLLTEESKIPMWSRSAAQIKLDVGSTYTLFGGNVTGEIKEVEKPKKLVQTWQTKSPGWPKEHFGTMTLVLNQGESSTKATFTLEGVPAGLENDIEKAIDAFYIRGLKQMGLGTIL